VQQALGQSSTDLATLCQSGAIKQWAKYRPVQYPLQVGSRYVQLLTDNQRASVNYGITNIPVWKGNDNSSRIANVVSVWVDGDTTSSKMPDGFSTGVPRDGWWARNLPTNTFRLADFASADDDSKGYFIRADAPIGNIKQITIESNLGLASVEYNMNVDGVTAGLTITYSDLTQMNGGRKPFTQLYFGVCIVCGSGSSRAIYLATQNNQVGEIDGAGTTLWSMAATVRFLVDSNSGALNTYLNNGTPFQIFPLLTTICNCHNPQEVSNPQSIRAINNNTNEVFIPLQEAETKSKQAFYLEGIIIDFYAWRTVPADKFIYYSATIRNNDATSEHDFKYRITIYDSNGVSLGTTLTSVISFAANEAKTFNNQNISVGSAGSARAAYSAKLEVYPQNFAYKRDTTSITTINNGLPLQA
jgi:hypothetical protein